MTQKDKLMGFFPSSFFVYVETTFQIIFPNLVTLKFWVLKILFIFKQF